MSFLLFSRSIHFCFLLVSNIEKSLDTSDQNDDAMEISEAEAELLLSTEGNAQKDSEGNAQSSNIPSDGDTASSSILVGSEVASSSNNVASDDNANAKENEAESKNKSSSPSPIHLNSENTKEYKDLAKQIVDNRLIKDWATVEKMKFLNPFDIFNWPVERIGYQVNDVFKPVCLQSIKHLMIGDSNVLKLVPKNLPNTVHLGINGGRLSHLRKIALLDCTKCHDCADNVESVGVHGAINDFTKIQNLDLFKKDVMQFKQELKAKFKNATFVRLSSNMFSKHANASQKARLNGKLYNDFLLSKGGRVISSAMRNDISGKHIRVDRFWAEFLGLEPFEQLIHADYQHEERTKMLLKTQQKQITSIKNSLKHLKPDENETEFTPPQPKRQNRNESPSPVVPQVTRLDRGRIGSRTKPTKNRSQTVAPNHRNQSVPRPPPNTSRPRTTLMFNGVHLEIQETFCRNGRIIISRSPLNLGIPITVHAIEQVRNLPRGLKLAHMELNLDSGFRINVSVLVKQSLVADWQSDTVLLPVLCAQGHPVASLGNFEGFFIYMLICSPW